VPGAEITRALYVDAPATTGMRDAWESELGFRPAGNQLRDLLWDQLTSGADPAGEAGPKPLMPRVGGTLELNLGGHSVIRSERFKWGRHRHTNQVQSVLQRDFESLWEETNGHEHCCRVLDYRCEKYRVADWQDIVPQRLRAHVPGRLPHATTYTDDFNRADGALTSPWVQSASNVFIDTNQLRMTGTPVIAYYNSVLSSDDMEGFMTLVTHSSGQGGGVYVRKQSGVADNNAYINWCRGDAQFELFKFVGGALTNIGAATDSSTGKVMLVGADGSSIYTELNGVTKHSVTDTSVTGYFYSGVRGYDGGVCRWDDWQVADIAVEPAKFYIFGPMA
jgi:hypothetical protein